MRSGREKFGAKAKAQEALKGDWQSFDCAKATHEAGSATSPPDCFSLCGNVTGSHSGVRPALYLPRRGDRIVAGSGWPAATGRAAGAHQGSER